METQEAAISGQQSFGHDDRLGLELQEITNAMVRIYKELFGHGPPKARLEPVVKPLRDQGGLGQ